MGLISNIIEIGTLGNVFDLRRYGKSFVERQGFWCPTGIGNGLLRQLSQKFTEPRLKESIIVLCRKEKMFRRLRPEATVYPLIEDRVTDLGEAKIKLWKLEQKMGLPGSWQKCPDMSYLKCYPV